MWSGWQTILAVNIAWLVAAAFLIRRALKKKNPDAMANLRASAWASPRSRPDSDLHGSSTASRDEAEHEPPLRYPYVIGALLGLGSIIRGLAIGTHHLGRSLSYIGIGAALFAFDAWVLHGNSRRSHQ